MSTPARRRLKPPEKLRLPWQSLVPGVRRLFLQSRLSADLRLQVPVEGGEFEDRTPEERHRRVHISVGGRGIEDRAGGLTTPRTPRRLIIFACRRHVCAGTHVGTFALRRCVYNASLRLRE